MGLHPDLIKHPFICNGTHSQRRQCSFFWYVLSAIRVITHIVRRDEFIHIATKVAPVIEAELEGPVIKLIKAPAINRN
jgi:hypothetical protein